MTVRFDFQENLPVFVREKYFDFVYNGKKYSYNQEIPWQELGVPAEKIRLLFAADKLYHNSALEIKAKSGDRLSEMDGKQLGTVVGLLNSVVKSKTTSKKEFDAKRCKISTIEDKQRGLLRSFLYNNPWITEEFYKARDHVLQE